MSILQNGFSVKQMELNTVMDVRCCEYCTAHHVTLHIFPSCVAPVK